MDWDSDTIAALETPLKSLSITFDYDNRRSKYAWTFRNSALPGYPGEEAFLNNLMMY